MSCDTSDRQDLRTRIFKFTVAGVVKDGRVGCGGVLYATSGIIIGMFLGSEIGSDLNLAVLFAIKSTLELFGKTRPWFSWPILVEIDSLLNQIGNVSFVQSRSIGGGMVHCLLLRFKLVEGSVSVMKGGEGVVLACCFVDLRLLA
ncbi:hypothetical protein V6N12_010163 [Hibiscus sabdariffa]|uniref:RNase H type-1 domain-containing protein n=1 Tax=Hibiscus sabdariffa TaxID=183260 RepID=A0ABR2ECX1_9ROSI